MAARKGLNIAERALPPEKRPKPAPPPFEMELPSGQWCQWRMPDPLAVITFDGVLPDRFTARTIQLLKEEKAYTPTTDALKFRNDATAIEGLWPLAAAMLVWPKFDYTVEYGEGDTLGRRELGYRDVLTLYWNFLIGTRLIPRPPAATDEPERAEDAS